MSTDIFTLYERVICVPRQDVEKIADMAHEAGVPFRYVFEAAKYYHAYTRGKLTYKRLDFIKMSYDEDNQAKIYQDMITLFGRNGYEMAKIVMHK